MSETRLNGIYTRESEIGQADYHLIQLSINDLIRLAFLINGYTETQSPCSIEIGLGSLSFEITQLDNFTAETSDNCNVLIRASPHNLKQLADKFQDMAHSDPDPNYLVHVHLDTFFTSPGIGLSDVVFQLLDENHDNTAR